MKNIILLAFAAALFTACNNKSATTTESQPSTEVVAAEPEKLTTCYIYKTDKLEVTMTLSGAGQQVSGVLTCNFAEKDDNSGIIKGEFKGDTLIADYTFKSEGTTSVRQVAFLRSGKILTEGYGDVDEKDGKMVFKNTGMLQFTGTALSEKPCEM